MYARAVFGTTVPEIVYGVLLFSLCLLSFRQRCSDLHCYEDADQANVVFVEFLEGTWSIFAKRVEHVVQP